MRELVLFNLRKKFLNKTTVIIIILEFAAVFLLLNFDFLLKDNAITEIKIDISAIQYEADLKNEKLNYRYDSQAIDDVVLFYIDGQWMIESKLKITNYQQNCIVQDINMLMQKEYLRSHQFMNDFFNEYNDIAIDVEYIGDLEKDNSAALIICTIGYFLLMNYSNLLSSEFLYQKNSGVLSLLLNNISIPQHFFSNIVYGYLVEIINMTILTVITLINIAISNQRVITGYEYQIVNISIMKGFLLLVLVMTSLFVIQVMILLLTSSFNNSSSATNFLACINILYLIIYYLAINYLSEAVVESILFRIICYCPILSLIMMPYRMIITDSYLPAVLCCIINLIVVYWLIRKGMTIYKKNLLK
ncbi:MAG: hypothetical protein ACI4WG_00875 [Erysipelotrichaceae bacterium]